jgi:TctA family transporter
MKVVMIVVEKTTIKFKSFFIGHKHIIWSLIAAVYVLFLISVVSTNMHPIFSICYLKFIQYKDLIFMIKCFHLCFLHSFNIESNDRWLINTLMTSLMIYFMEDLDYRLIGKGLNICLLIFS